MGVCQVVPPTLRRRVRRGTVEPCARGATQKTITAPTCRPLRAPVQAAGSCSCRYLPPSCCGRLGRVGGPRASPTSRRRSPCTARTRGAVLHGWKGAVPPRSSRLTFTGRGGGSTPRPVAGRRPRLGPACSGALPPTIRHQGNVRFSYNAAKPPRRNAPPARTAITDPAKRDCERRPAAPCPGEKRAFAGWA